MSYLNLKMLLSVMLCFMILEPLFSQNTSLIDSLRNNVEKAKGSEKVQALNKLAFKFAFNNFDSALTNIEKALTLSHTYGYDSLNTEAYNIKGVIYDVKGMTDSSEFYFLKTYSLSIERGIATYTRFSINNLGMMYWRRGDFNQALEYFFKALKLAEESKNTKLTTIALSNIGLIYQQMNQFEKALDYHQKALIYRKQNNTVNDFPASYNNLGVCYKGILKFDSAQIYYNKAIEYARLTSNTVEESAALANLGNVFFNLNEYKKAESYYLQSIKIEGIPLKTVMHTNESLSAVYYALGNYRKGIAYGLKAKQIMGELKSDAISFDVYLYLALNYAALHEIEKAQRYMTQYKEVTDSLFSDKNATAINKLEVAYQTEKKEKELLAEKAEKEKAEKEKYLMQLEVYKRNRWLMVVSFTGLLLVALVLIIMQLNKRKSQKEKDLAIITEKERGLAAIINAQEEERKRVAKDLHDGVGQQISAVHLNFQVLAQKIKTVVPELVPELENVKRLITETGADIRTVSHQMMPRALTEFGLVDAIQDIIDKNFSTSGITVRFEHQNMEKRLHQNIEIGLYRIVQELLTNIIKHSGATQAELQLFKTSAFVMLIVHDNGKGINNPSTGGMGMLNMNSRINAMKGEFHLESESGSGTTATIKVKL